MNLNRLSTQVHKWMALIVGVQIVFWVGGGLVMTALPIERVRSEHHIAEPRLPPLPAAGLVSPAEAARRAGFAPVEATLKQTLRGPVWVLKPAKGDPVTLSAVTGGPLPPFQAAEARRLAAAAYKGPGKPVSTTYLAEAPFETRKKGPLWRVDFGDEEKTSFYLSPETGEVVSRRSELWRFFDFFWRLHTMDWKTGDDFNHPLIVITAALSLIVVVTGVVMLVFRLQIDWRNRRRRRDLTA